MTDALLLQEFEALTKRLEIGVVRTDLKGRSGGFCIIRGERRFILDKHLDVQTQVRIFAREFRKLPLDGYFLMPAVREAIAEASPAWA